MWSLTGGSTVFRFKQTDLFIEPLDGAPSSSWNMLLWVPDDFFLANSWERLAFSINLWYTCKYCTAFKLLSFSKQVPFAISNTWGTNSLKCCEHSINILVLRHWHTGIECDFQMFCHRVYFLNVRLKSWLSIVLIFLSFSLVILSCIYQGGSVKLTMRLWLKTRPSKESQAKQLYVFLFSAIISNFLSAKVMGEESENLESTLGINLSLLM